MTWDEVQDSEGFNLTGLFAVITAFILNLLNGTLLHVFPNLKLPEMNINDVLTIVLSVIAGIYTIVKIYHEILKIIEKRRDMKQAKFFDDSLKDRIERMKDNVTVRNKRGEEKGSDLDNPTS
jgi:hypothetical protein